MLVNETQALALLKRGDICAIPTETVYGLAARIDVEAALKNIFATKTRPFFDPLIVHVAGVEDARALTEEWPVIYDTLAAKFWPGPLTLIAPKSALVSSLITAGLTTVGLRCPDHPMALALLEKLPAPFAAPSANRFGRTSPTEAAHVESEFAGQVPVLDGGSCQVGVESTVLSANLLDGRWQIKIHRPGAVTSAHIAEALKSVPHSITREHSPASPGQLKAHYQPDSPVILLKGISWTAEIQARAEASLKIKIEDAVELRLPDSPAQAARVLYAELRRLSRTSRHAIYITIDGQKSGADWEAIWDRIGRAAAAEFTK